MRLLFILFLIISALEIGIFVWVGSLIGPWWVIALIVLTSIIGISIAKQQGIETWRRAQQAMYAHQVPGEQIIDGMYIFIGAVLLFIPGFITDVVGIILVLPWTRKLCKGFLYKLVSKMIDKNIIHIRFYK